MITVFVTDDHYMVVEGIRSLLAAEKDIDFIGSASSIASCRAFLQRQQPDVLLLDISLPDGSGIDLCREVRTDYPAIAILGLSTFNQASFIRNMMNNGACGYLLKNASQKELTEAIHMASIGQTYMAFEVARTLHEAEKASQGKILLARREKQVLLMLTKGLTNQEIAAELFVSAHTVDTYRRNLLTKLKAKNTADLVRIAYLQKLVEG